jgi:hypothetical protein
MKVVTDAPFAARESLAGPTAMASRVVLVTSGLEDSLRINYINI